MYQNLYENEQIHATFYTTNSNEVPVVSSIRQSLKSESLANTCSSSLNYEVIPSVDAVKMPIDNVDARPRFLDTLSGQYCLVDSGSAVTAVEPGPQDVVNPDLALIAANGVLWV